MPSSHSHPGTLKNIGLPTSVATDQYTAATASRGVAQANTNASGRVRKQTNTAGVNGARLGT